MPQSRPPKLKITGARTARVRGMAGMILDGGVRDVARIRGLGLPVYAASVSPATAAGRYASVAANIPVQCGGVTINPGGILAANEDGVVTVPKDKAQEVLTRAIEIDERETKMAPMIQRQKPLSKVIAILSRI
jgi:regulator of RNase E activity RraA